MLNTMKTERCDAKYVFPNVTGSGHKDNLRWHQWRQILQYNVIAYIRHQAKGKFTPRGLKKLTLLFVNDIFKRIFLNDVPIFYLHLTEVCSWGVPLSYHN